MVTDLLSGRLDASAIGAAAIIPFIKAGKVRCIATGLGQAACRSCPTCRPWPSRASGLRDDAVVRHARARATSRRAQLAKLSSRDDEGGEVARRRCSGSTRDAAEAVGGTPEQFAQFIASGAGAVAEGDRARAGIKPD